MNWAWGVLLVLLMISLAKIRQQNGGRVSRVTRLSEAIAKAEGYYVPNSLPNRNNNPGALTDASGTVRFYATAEAGWQALYTQVSAMLNDLSRYYNSGMTIREVAQIYTGGDKPDAWATIVAGELGLSTDAHLYEVV